MVALPIMAPKSRLNPKIVRGPEGIASMQSRTLTVSVLLLCTGVCRRAWAPQADALPFRDPQLPMTRRVDDLIARMTLEEKVSQLVHTADAIPRLGVPAYNWWNEGLHG